MLGTNSGTTILCAKKQSGCFILDGSPNLGSGARAVDNNRSKTKQNKGIFGWKAKEMMG
jgi:hypothetical protein